MADYDTAIRRSITVLLGILVVLSIVELSISAWLVARFNNNHNYRNLGERDRVRYTMFVSIWTIVIGTPYLLVFVLGIGGFLTSVLSYLIFFFVTWSLWLAAAASVTDTLGGGLDCGMQTLFVYCGQLNALEAFAWILWVFSSIAFFIVILRAFANAHRGEGYKGGLVSAS